MSKRDKVHEKEGGEKKQNTGLPSLTKLGPGTLTPEQPPEERKHPLVGWSLRLYVKSQEASKFNALMKDHGSGYEVETFIRPRGSSSKTNIVDAITRRHDKIDEYKDLMDDFLEKLCNKASAAPYELKLENEGVKILEN